MNPIIKRALFYLENANYAGYFEELDKISMPFILKNSYSTHKGKFIAGKCDWDFAQQLSAFSSELDAQLPKEEILNLEKEVENTQQTMNNTTNFTVSDLHEQTYVFLFGTSEYAADSGLTPMLNVEVNLIELKELFINEQGIKSENIRSFLNQTGDD